MKALTKEAILGADDIVLESIEVPEWGGTVYVRTMSGTARERWEERASGEQIQGAMGLLLVGTICDENGELLFTEEDVDAIGAKSCSALIKVYEQACSLNRLTAAEVDEVAGNLPSDPNGVSG